MLTRNCRSGDQFSLSASAEPGTGRRGVLSDEDDIIRLARRGVFFIVDMGVAAVTAEGLLPAGELGPVGSEGSVRALRADAERGRSGSRNVAAVGPVAMAGVVVVVVVVAGAAVVVAELALLLAAPVLTRFAARLLPGSSHILRLDVSLLLADPKA